MKITLDMLSMMSKRLLRTLDRAEIRNTLDLRNNIGVKHKVSDDEREFVAVTFRPSNRDTLTYTISYIVPDLGIPLEAKINTVLDYTKIILKAEAELPGYLTFSRDIFGNLQQIKDLHTAGLDIVQRELESL